MLAVTLKVFWPILLTPETLRFFCKRFPIMWYLGFVLRSFRGHIVWSESQWTKQNALDFSYNIFFFFYVFNHSRIVDQVTGTEIASFPIYKVLFCARGHEGSAESDCFSFTESYRSSEEFQIHVFSCHIKEAVSSVMFSVQSQSWNAEIN